MKGIQLVSGLYFKEQKKQFKREEGFTIIELLIAMAIFAIGILAVGSMQITATKGNTSSGKMTSAVTTAQNQVEQLICLDYDDTTDLNDANGDGTAGLSNNTAATADHTAANGQYNIYWNIADDDPIRNTKTIEVIVSWQGGRRQVALTTVKANTM